MVPLQRPLVLAALALFVRHDVADDLHRRLAREPRFDAVAAILSGERVIGSGVLIDERWVLTDAHVLKAVELETVSVRFGEAAGLGVSHEEVHPEYEAPALATAPSALERKGVDLALLRLAGPADGVEPVRRAAADVPVGTRVLLCGYGSWGTGDDLQPKSGPGVKRAGTNVIDAVGLGEGTQRVPELYYVCDMDSAAGDRNASGDATPTELEAVGVGGDSGGGAFATIDGEWRLVGIFSTARFDTSQEVLQGYGTLNFLTRVVAVADWIDEVVGAGEGDGKR